MSLEYERKGNEGEERGTGVWEERKVKRGENGAISNNKEIKDSDVLSTIYVTDLPVHFNLEGTAVSMSLKPCKVMNKPIQGTH